MPCATLSLGSNLGQRHENLRQAIFSLQERVGSVVACSAFITTQPWGFESEHEFLNAVVRVNTGLTPRQLLLETQKIERDMGRLLKSRDGVYHDRVIDIDILTYDDMVMDEHFVSEDRELTLQLPHPHMRERDFVMIPLRQIEFDI